ncbi:MAG: restriction endonuclease subunit S [Candidatus Accumulibacter sp.]|uniref:restriction endonuclease subunit S n=1 Tax=Accumulibacter sp. TaxID=2053492 RepID=UPI00258B1DAD|nr:restriction endonuclease subunit S [Accumulibacter sp.]MBK8116099.1 restriction endonuclease subunit S [Accumulibacter sp.]
MSDYNLLIDPLPAGWKNHLFGDVCDRVKDSYQPVDGGDTPYVGLEHLAQGFPAFVGRGTESDIKSSKTAFKAGDILFGKLRPYLRKGARADFDGVCSTDILAFRARAGCEATFLHFLIHCDEFIDHAKSTTSGVQHPRTSWPSLKEFRLTLPPLPEQKKIAHILSTVQRAIEAQERIIQTTTELKKALMHKLLTEGLRNEPQKQTEIGPMPESWEVVELGSLAKVGNGSTPKRANEAYWEGGTIPWLNSTKIHDRFITEADQFVTPQAVKECHLPRVAPNSLLIAITGQGKTLGNSAITRIETCINQHLAYAQFHAAKIVPVFVLWFMQTRYDNLRAIAHGGGSTKGALTCGFLKTLPIPVPSRAEQEEIATTFQTLEDKQHFAVRRQAGLQNLFRTLLHQLMTAKTRVHELGFSV